LTLFLSILSFVLFFMLCFSVYFNYKFGKTIVEIQESLERSLDVLDQRYLSISSVLEKPIFFDSVEVRQVVDDIKQSRDAVLYVANVLIEPFEEENSNKNESGNPS